MSVTYGQLQGVEAIIHSKAASLFFSNDLNNTRRNWNRCSVERYIETLDSLAPLPQFGLKLIDKQR
jgi:hypothetical protein